jgi:hypothetical protein
MPDWTLGSDTESFPTYNETMSANNNDFSNFNLGSMWSDQLPDSGGQSFYTNVGGNGDNYQLGGNKDYLPELAKQGISFQGQYGNNGLYSQMLKNGTNQGTRFQSFDDPLFGALIDTGVGGVLGGASFLGGGGLAGNMGFNGTLGQMINGAATGGLTAAGNDRNVLQGAAGGAFGGGVAGLNPAGSLGFDKGVSANMINSGIGGFGQSLVNGQGLGQAFSNGALNALTSGAKSGINSAGSFLTDSFSKLFGDETPLNSDPSKNASYPPGWAPGGDIGQALGVELGNNPMMSYAPPSSSYGNGQGYNPLQTQQEPSQKQASSFSMPSSSSVGNFVGNHLGDIATGLYGMYNSRRQQQAIGQQMASLQGLYGGNSPYAQQLRAKLQAQAAARGTRSDTSGREVQLQAALADRAAQSSPYLFQMQQAQNKLQNNNMMSLLSMGKDTGLFKGLGGLFQQQQQPQNTGGVGQPGGMSPDALAYYYGGS